MSKSLKQTKSNELVELTSTEMFLQESGISMTLNDIANKYEKRHSNLKRDFFEAYSKLTETNIDMLRFEQTSYIDSSNRKQQTLALPIHTLVWFISKFDENLRADIINYAFTRLQDEHKQEVLAEIKKAKAPRVYKDGRQSVRGCLATAWKDDEDAPTETEIWKALKWKKIAETKPKVTVQNVLPDDKVGIVDAVDMGKGAIVYNPDLVRSVWEAYELAGEPNGESEYDRLVAEFAEVTKHYEERLKEAKKNNI